MSLDRTAEDAAKDVVAQELAEQAAASARLRADALDEVAAFWRRLVEREIDTLDPYQRREIRLELRIGGPLVVLAWEEATGLELGIILETCGQNLDARLEGGKIVVYCPSWPDEDPIPF